MRAADSCAPGDYPSALRDRLRDVPELKANKAERAVILELLGWYYIVGYYSEQEALEQALELGKTIQSQFSSWDEFMESRFRGYAYWSCESSGARREINLIDHSIT